MKTEKQKYSIFAIFGVIGFIYGMFLYGLPMIGSALGYPMQFLPIPWFDANEFLERFLPGASFGIATELLLFAFGMVLPFNILVSMFIGSFGVFFILNWLLVKFG